MESLSVRQYIRLKSKYSDLRLLRYDNESYFIFLDVAQCFPSSPEACDLDLQDPFSQSVL